MDVTAETDPNFEPLLRARSNTWPVRPKDLSGGDDSKPVSNILIGAPEIDIDKDCDTSEKRTEQSFPSKKVGGSRRNAWGNLSYADLITKAIQSSAEQRLTLSQIYDWMVQNVPYFRDKGDSNSSAGWKNSIRHNLSLHSRFMRVQNEGTGKSSWWVLNPDAKPGKTPRRRATSMDTKAYEKKRGRVKKKVEALRAAMAGENLAQSGGCFGGSGQELNLPDSFSLSPQDFRQRTSSNASSMGRLSPIQSVLEPDLPDLHDGQVPPMSPVPWVQNMNTPYSSVQESFADQSLSESLAEMFVGEPGIEIQDSLLRNLQPSVPSSQQITCSQGFVGHCYDGQLHNLQSSQMIDRKCSAKPTSLPQIEVSQVSEPRIDSMPKPQPFGESVHSTNEMYRHYGPQTLSELLDIDSSNIHSSVFSSADMTSPPKDPCPYSAYSVSTDSTQEMQNSEVGSQNSSVIQDGPLSINNSLLRQALTTHTPLNLKHTGSGRAGQVLQAHSQNQDQGTETLCVKQHGTTDSALGPATIQQQLMAGGTMHTNATSLPADIDMTLTGDFSGCDVDQILKHELTFDDNLDFNFDSEQVIGEGICTTFSQGLEPSSGTLKT